jgi:phosphate transport system ATP-binding protein
MLLGELIEHSDTDDLFLNPRNAKTADHIEGRYGREKESFFEQTF